MEKLILEEGNTGKNDNMSVVIFVGDTLRDHNGIEVVVYEPSNKHYTVATDPSQAAFGPSLNLWLSMSQTIEVVQKKDFGPGSNL